MANKHDWLSLVDLSGLLVSEPVLNEVFPAGPSPVEPRRVSRLRSEYERWLAGKGSRDDQARKAAFRRWVSYVLHGVLQYPDDRLLSSMSLPPDLTIELAEYMQRLRPDMALTGPDGHPAAGLPHRGRLDDGADHRALVASPSPS
jgi:hypothetical protein